MPKTKRQKLTQLLCWLIGAGTIVALGGTLIFLALLLSRGVYSAWVVIALLVIGLAVQVFMLVLWLWRKCERCSWPLFPAVFGLISELGRVPQYPDYRAEKFLGSYHWGPIVSMATRGVVHCAKCGHKDGSALEYVVTART